jgi:hypothetical protein
MQHLCISYLEGLHAPDLPFLTEWEITIEHTFVVTATHG